MAVKVGDGFDDVVHVAEAKIKQQTNDILLLQIQLDILNEKVDDAMSENQLLAKSKRYFSTVRLLVYDALMNQVPTVNVPTVLERFCMRLGYPINESSHRSTVEQMAREMGIIAQLQTAEEIMNNRNVTLAFDATTQGGIHINAALVTTEKSAFCYCN